MIVILQIYYDASLCNAVETCSISMHVINIFKMYLKMHIFSLNFIQFTWVMLQVKKEKRVHGNITTLREIKEGQVIVTVIV